jgi:glycosyltransferase involved in cell wall biosynthesis
MIKNLENIEKYFYPSDLSLNRKNGVSAIVRVKNEEEFIIPSLLSVKDFFDEFIIILNQCTDKTPILLNALKLPNTKIFYYDEYIVPAGPESLGLDSNSIHSIVYYTNYCISLSNYKWIYRFDADHIALPMFFEMKHLIKSDRYNSVEDRGIDLVGSNCNMLGSQEMCSFEKRLVRISSGFKYVVAHSNMSEMPNSYGISYRIESPTFLHMKWCCKDSGRKWTKGWQGIHHFKSIKDRHDPVKNYNDPLPDILKLYLDLDKDPYKLIDLYHKGKI